MFNPLQLNKSRMTDSSQFARGKGQDSAWQPLCPIPANAPKRPVSHFRYGVPSSVWDYRNAEDLLFGHVVRFDLPDDRKEVLPLTYCRNNETGATKWRWLAMPKLRPLYNLPELSTLTNTTILVVEGEKSADAGRRLLPDHVVVTSSGGSKAASKTDWRPLAGRHVLIWPDADKPGLTYASDVAQEATRVGARSVKIVTIPDGFDEGWDIADAEADGWDTKRAEAQLISSVSVPSLQTNQSGGQEHPRSGANDPSVKQSKPDNDGRQRRPPHRDNLLKFANECELWHSPDGNAYATLPIKSHRENWGLRSREFKRWLAARYYAEHQGAVSSQATEDGIRVLEAIAVIEGPCHEPMRRVGELGNAMYLDLANSAWQVIEITKNGWQTIVDPPVKFVRTQYTRPLPEPEAGGMIEELRGFINVATDGDFVLLVAWLISALRNRGPFPILMLHGEQGSAKSTASRLLRSLVDPNKAAIRSTPKDERDLIISASNSWIQAFDNMSTVPGWLSDAFCRLSTGGGFGTRALHTDNDEFIFDGQRPVILNGIPDLTGRPDLGSRALPIELPIIPDNTRRPEDELMEEFDAARPSILGALLNGVSAGMRHLPTTKLDRIPRMADFAKWVTAAEPGLGIDSGSFLSIYAANQRTTVDASLETNPVALALKAFIQEKYPDGFEGQPAKLWQELTDFVPDRASNSRSWPQAPNAFGTAFKRISPLLRDVGFEVDRGHSGDRFIRIVPPPASG